MEATARPQLIDAHKQVLADRGISIETATAAGLRTAASLEAKNILGLDPKSPGILIPYSHPTTRVIRTFRFRPDEPLIVDGKPAKYLSPRGVGNIFYFPPDVGGKLQDVAAPIFFTEGEIKSLAASQAGLLCIGLIGVWGWRAGLATGESGPVADFDLIDMRGRAATIIFDSDVLLNRKVANARQRLAKELYRRGASSVTAIDLPAPDGMKVGLDDYLVKFGIAALLDLDVVELSPTDMVSPVESLSDMRNAPEEPIEWGIMGLQPLGASGWRIAGPKVGKSWSMLEEAYCLTTGQSCYGKFAVPEKRRVLIVEEEDPRRRLRGRLERIINAHGGEVPGDDYFKLCIKKGMRLDNQSWREVLEYEVKKFLPHFVYLDVFSRLHSQDPSDPKAMAEIVLFLDQLNRDYGTAFIILHHTRKNKSQGATDDFDEILGSRVLGGFAEATLFFSKTKERGILKVSVSLKDEPDEFEPEFMLRRADTDDGQGTAFEYLGVPADKAANAEIRQKIMDVLRAADKALTVTEVSKLLKISRPTAREHLNALVDIKFAIRVEPEKGKTKLYVMAPESAENFQ